MDARKPPDRGLIVAMNLRVYRSVARVGFPLSNEGGSFHSAYLLAFYVVVEVTGIEPVSESGPRAAFTLV